MIETYYQKNVDYIINIIASSSAGAVNKNIEIINNKTRGTNIMLYFITAGFISLTASFALLVVFVLTGVQTKT